MFYRIGELISHTSLFAELAKADTENISVGQKVQY